MPVITAAQLGAVSLGGGDGCSCPHGYTAKTIAGTGGERCVITHCPGSHPHFKNYRCQAASGGTYNRDSRAGWCPHGWTKMINYCEILFRTQKLNCDKGFSLVGTRCYADCTTGYEARGTQCFPIAIDAPVPCQ